MKSCNRDIEENFNADTATTPFAELVGDILDDKCMDVLKTKLGNVVDSIMKVTVNTETGIQTEKKVTLVLLELAAFCVYQGANHRRTH